MRKLSVILLVLVLLGMMISAGGVRAEEAEEPESDLSLELESDFAGGKLYKAGNINVLELHGTYREMGRQYGKLFGKEIGEMYDLAIKTLASETFNSKVEDPVKFEEECMKQYEHFPRRVKEIALGISDVTGMPLSHIAFIDQIFVATLFNWQREYAGEAGKGKKKSSGHCSSAIAWGEYTGTGPLVMGRNLDYSVAYRDFDKYLTVIIYCPSDGSNAVATIGYAGAIGGMEFFNSAGLAVELNDGSMISAPNNEMYNDRIPFNISLLTMMFDSSNLSELDAAMKTTRMDYPILCNVADRERGYTYEIGTRDVIRRGDIHEGIQAVANTPIDPFWKMPAKNISKEFKLSMDNSAGRRNNILALLEKCKGSIDVKTMENIMSTPITAGGPFWEEAEGVATIYQFVYAPQTFTLFVRPVGFQDWTEIKLAPLFVKE
ncbi:MAG: C45 family autoproteolytic acyltransferase/hydrolase [Candidatus Omnitrophica bacterium]|nr:C45 family autoproteolytic acyltransferase/hydrolase [Candidatus Omnitrophota bacterium]